MLVDIYRGFRIVLKFVFYDMWKWLIDFLFRKQNQKIKESYTKRITYGKRKRLLS